ncbi:hypothetical protein GCM10009742_03210 [Kribbella karoonensis]|uniref:Uncharacterized protein n=1 Tax=Kribbella karoonensis TaxID=324851 RepID=A0ABP4NR52_9ACTN
MPDGEVLGVVGVPVVELPDVGPDVVGPVVVGPVVVGPVVVGPAVVGPAVVGPAVVGPPVVGPAVVPPVEGPVVDGSVVVGPDVVEPPGVELLVVVPGGAAQVGPFGVAVAAGGSSDGVIGTSGLPAGSDGRALERVVPSVRSTVGTDAFCVAWLSAGSGFPNGTRNQTAANATTSAASPPSFRTGRRRRLCRALNFRACRPRWSCLTD